MVVIDSEGNCLMNHVVIEVRPRVMNFGCLLCTLSRGGIPSNLSRAKHAIGKNHAVYWPSSNKSEIDLTLNCLLCGDTAKI